MFFFFAKKRLNNRKEWSQIKKTPENNVQNDFHSKFLKEFTSSKLIDYNNENKYTRVNFEDDFLSQANFIKTANNPFNFKLKQLPDVILSESLALMYEEVNKFIIFLFYF